MKPTVITTRPGVIHRYRHRVDELPLGEPVILVHHAAIEKRHDGEAAAKDKGAPTLDHCCGASPPRSTRRNAAYSARSYAIFSTPHATSGAAMAPAANMAPVIVGLTAAARLRGTEVKLAAAGRSAGVTTDITNAPRAGTSICDSRLRASRHASAMSRRVASAAPMRNRLDGMCVNTMVLTMPMRRARGAAASCEQAERSPVQKKNAPAAASESP